MEQISVLLLSNDAAVVGMTNRIFDDYGFAVSAVKSVPEADALIKHNTFDLAVFDNDVPGAFNLAPQKPSGSTPRVVFGMVNRAQGRELQGKRVHFMVQKPFSADLFLKSLRAAYGVMLREKRAAHREEIGRPASSATLVHDGVQRSVARVIVVNVSKTGIGLEAREMLPQGSTLQLSFQLPDTEETVQVSGTIMWTYKNGKAGIRFTHVLPADQKRLHAWIDSKLPGENDFVPRPASQQRSPTTITGSLKKVEATV